MSFGIHIWSNNLVYVVLLEFFPIPCSLLYLSFGLLQVFPSKKILSQSTSAQIPFEVLITTLVKFRILGCVLCVSNVVMSLNVMKWTSSPTYSVECGISIS